MTANEIIEIVENEDHNPFLEEITDMLRQQEKEIEKLKQEIQSLKSKVQYWKAREK